jgi:hypothetical protein
MEVGRGLLCPRQTMLDDVQIDTTSYAMVKVDMVHDNSKDLKLEVPLDDTTLTVRYAVTRRVQWRQTSIDIDPSAAASVLTTPSQLNTSPSSMSPEAHLSPSPNPEQLVFVSNLKPVASVSNSRAVASVSNSRSATEVSA